MLVLTRGMELNGGCGQNVQMVSNLMLSVLINNPHYISSVRREGPKLDEMTGAVVTQSQRSSRISSVYLQFQSQGKPIG